MHVTVVNLVIEQYSLLHISLYRMRTCMPDILGTKSVKVSESETHLVHEITTRGVEIRLPTLVCGLHVYISDDEAHCKRFFGEGNCVLITNVDVVDEDLDVVRNLQSNTFKPL